MARDTTMITEKVIMLPTTERVSTRSQYGSLGWEIGSLTNFFLSTSFLCIGYGKGKGGEVYYGKGRCGYLYDKIYYNFRRTHTICIKSNSVLFRQRRLFLFQIFQIERKRWFQGLEVVVRQGLLWLRKRLVYIQSCTQRSKNKASQYVLTKYVFFSFRKGRLWLWKRKRRIRILWQRFVKEIFITYNIFDHYLDSHNSFLLQEKVVMTTLEAQRAREVNTTARAREVNTIPLHPLPVNAMKYFSTRTTSRMGTRRRILAVHLIASRSMMLARMNSLVTTMMQPPTWNQKIVLVQAHSASEQIQTTVHKSNSVLHATVNSTPLQAATARSDAPMGMKN